jgi:hypothetical protein
VALGFGAWRRPRGTTRGDGGSKYNIFDMMIRGYHWRSYIFKHNRFEAPPVAGGLSGGLVGYGHRLARQW